jgi:hypothetical protein
MVSCSRSFVVLAVPAVVLLRIVDWFDISVFVFDDRVLTIVATDVVLELTADVREVISGATIPTGVCNFP